MSLEQLRSIFEEHLPLFDAVLAQQGRSLSTRPLHAVALFVTECIVEIKGESKDDIVDQPWFNELMRWSETWYLQRYGEALRSTTDRAHGLVLIYSTPFALEFPLTLTGEETPGETIWMMFPSSVTDQETPLDWLSPRPNLDKLSSEEMNQILTNITTVVSRTRSIHINLMTAGSTSLSNVTLSGVLDHIEKAVSNVLAESEPYLVEN